MCQQRQCIDPPLSGQLVDVPLAEPAPVTTWAEIVAIDPDIPVIIAEAEAIPVPSWVDYAVLKSSLSKLVGWSARAPRLSSQEAYTIATRKLLEALRL